jgi:hypothetical protein
MFSVSANIAVAIFMVSAFEGNAEAPNLATGVEWDET